MSQSRESVLRPLEDNRDYMNDRIKSGIETHRKGHGTLRFIDSQGNPLAGVHAELTQRTHDFHYGANLFLLDELPEADRNRQYKELFKGAFNLATLPFYWRDLEPEQGKPRFAADSPKVYRRPAPDLCLDYCEKNGITPKAHCLVYDPFTPDWVPRETGRIKSLYEKRMAELSERYARRIHGWEVINETLFDDGPNHTPFYREFDLADWSFERAARHFPLNELIINEAHSNIWNRFVYNRSPYFMQIENLLHRGARIDAIGMQYHMFYRREAEARETALYYDPRRIYDVMDCYAALGRPLQITEVTIPAYGEAKEDEDIQAEIIEAVYSMWFSHPAMEAIIYWNLVDGYAYVNPKNPGWDENYYFGGLIRHDFTPKPAYRRIRELFNERWRTRETLHTGQGNTAAFKGFYGEYDLRITREGKTYDRTLHLTRSGDRDITLTL